MTTLADRINQIIAETEHTQQKIGDIVGVSTQTVGQWRNGIIKNIRMEHLFRLADGTGYEARWIATGDGPAKSPTNGDGNGITEPDWQNLPPGERAHFAQALHAIADTIAQYHKKGAVNDE